MSMYANFRTISLLIIGLDVSGVAANAVKDTNIIITIKIILFIIRYIIVSYTKLRIQSK